MLFRPITISRKIKKIIIKKKQTQLLYIFPEKLFQHLTNPNLESQTCSCGTGTHTSSMSSLEEAVLFFQAHWTKFRAFIRTSGQLKLNYHGHGVWHSFLLTTGFLVLGCCFFFFFFQMLSSKRVYADITKIFFFKSLRQNRQGGSLQLPT